jgi:hypothetical protein
VIGQKVSNKQINENVLYIIETLDNVFLIDELTYCNADKDNFCYKFYSRENIFNQPFQVKKLWRVISLVDIPDEL